jgi:hypothetical protein
MKMLQITLRELLLAVVVFALGVGWALDRSRWSAERRVIVQKCAVLERMLVQSLNQIKAATGRHTTVSVDELGLDYESSP